MSGSETLTEVAVRKYLSKSDLQAILSSTNRATSGPKEDLAERVLSDTGLDLPALFGRVPLEDLKKLLRELDIPGPKEKGFFQLSATEALKGERGRLVDYIVEKAKEQGYTSKPVASKSAAVPSPTPPVPSQGPPRAPPEPPATPPVAVTVRVQAEAVNASSAPPSFEAVNSFIQEYSFPFTWEDETYYEAELLGALRTRFGESNVSRQQPDGGKRYDIVVKGAARIELKLPSGTNAKAELDRMETQVQRYIDSGGLRVIVVIFMHEVKNRQDIFDRRTRMQQRGATVLLK
ncbi:MAG TPA: hypothetical protein VFG07_09045 [Thermoplasmata archaeon]|nr:hypothetical protein [Thermoplasmata archaeon]